MGIARNKMHLARRDEIVVDALIIKIEQYCPLYALKQLTIYTEEVSTRLL